MKKLIISLLLFCFIACTPRCNCDIATAFATGAAIQMVPSPAHDGLMTMASHQDCNLTEGLAFITGVVSVALVQIGSFFSCLCHQH